MRRTAFLLPAAAALLIAACGGSNSGAAKTTAGGATTPATTAGPAIRIGSKNFTEEIILGELYAQALEAKGIPVSLKSNIGPTEIVHSALTHGTLDMYPEYIGTLLAEVALEKHPSNDASVAYRDATAYEHRRGFTLLKTTPFEDRDAVAVTPKYARKHDLRTVADLRRVHGRVRIAAPGEFQSRQQGLLGLQRIYHLTNLSFVAKPIGAQYGPLEQGQVQSIDVFTTDGQLAQGCCVVLTDPKGVFGTQHVAPIISEKMVARYGKRLTDTLDAVSALLTTRVMQQMNAAVDIDHRKPAAVAAQFLRTHSPQ